MVNWSLGNMLQCVVGDHSKNWDLALPQIEFAYNCLPDRSTGRPPFSIVYTKAPDKSIDLVAIPHPKSMATVDFADQITQLHQDMKQKLE